MSSQENKEISKVIEVYLSAIKTGKSNHFESAFYPDAVVINAGEEDPNTSVIPLADFMARVKGRHEAGTELEEIPHGITISYVSKVANVRLDFELIIGDQTLFGTDYFNLVKRKGQWRISQKIYDVTHTK